jgi:transposase
MRFYTKQHKSYCGIDLHARRMDVCVLHQDGDRVLPRHMQARPDTFLRTVAPSRDALVVAVAGVFPWDWLADLCAQAGMPFGLGHALSMTAIHGGKATNDTIDAHTMAGLRRGGLLPQAYVYPAERRAPRDLWRRRLSLARKRAALLAHLQHPNSQDHLPESGPKLAYTANRDGVAERFPAPAVQQSMAVALALIRYDAHLLRDVALPSVKAAQQHDAQTLSWLQTVPGIGQILRLGLLYEMHAIQRVPRVQDVGSSCRLVTGAKASAGQRDGTAGTKIGNASLQWAFAEAAVVLLRDHPAGQQDRARLEKKHGTGTAVPGLAQPLGRAVYARLRRNTGCDRDNVLYGEGSGAGEPAASLGPERTSRVTGLCNTAATASTNAHEPRGALSCPGAFAGTPAPLLSCRERRESLLVAGCGPSPEPGTHWRMHLCRPSLA